MCLLLYIPPTNKYTHIHTKILVLLKQTPRSSCLTTPLFFRKSHIMGTQGLNEINYDCHHCGYKVSKDSFTVPNLLNPTQEAATEG